MKNGQCFGGSDDGAFLGTDLTVGARTGVKPAHQKSQKTLFNF